MSRVQRPIESASLVARVQVSAEVQSVAERGAFLLAELHERLGEFAGEIHDDDWPLAHGARHALLAVADAQRRLVALVEVAEATAVQVRLRAQAEANEP